MSIAEIEAGLDQETTVFRGADVELTPGEWHLGATRESVPPSGGEVTEWATLHPVRVTGDLLAPAATGATEAAVELELSDFAFVGLDAPVPAGPRVWQLTSAAAQPHHVVLVRVDAEVTAKQVMSEAAGMMAGTPPAEDSVFSRMVGVGYSALLSPGQTVWHELDLAPGNYLDLCFIFDPEIGMPHLMLGMASQFVVE